LTPLALGVVALGVVIEDAFPQRARHAAAGVPHLQHGVRATLPRPQVHAAVRGVAQGVVQQVAQGALHKHRVGQAAQARAGVAGPAQPLGVEGGPHLGMQGAQQRRDRQHLGPVRVFAGVQASDVEQLVKDKAQAVQGGLHAFGRALLFARVVSAAQQARQQGQAVQRLAQVMAGRGQKVALLAVGLLGLIAGLAHVLDLAGQLGQQGLVAPSQPLGVHQALLDQATHDQTGQGGCREDEGDQGVSLTPRDQQPGTEDEQDGQAGHGGHATVVGGEEHRGVDEHQQPHKDEQVPAFAQGAPQAQGQDRPAQALGQFAPQRQGPPAGVALLGQGDMAQAPGRPQGPSPRAQQQQQAAADVPPAQPTACDHGRQGRQGQQLSRHRPGIQPPVFAQLVKVDGPIVGRHLVERQPQESHQASGGPSFRRCWCGRRPAPVERGWPHHAPAGWR